VLGNSERLITRLIQAGLEAGEPIWQLPLEEEYLDGFKEGIADLNNIGKTKAQTIGGALFLSEFVKGGVQWAHLDIAAAAWANEDRLYRKKGATGAGTALFIKFLLGF
jgi:leucyl aminopeptidase